MIIAKKNLHKSEDSQIAQFQFQVPSFEVKIDSSVQISKANSSCETKVEAPISRELAISASEMISGLAMRYPELAVQTQANADRDKVKILLQDYV